MLAGEPIDSLRTAAGVTRTSTGMSLLAADVGFAEALAHSEIGDRDRAAVELADIAGAAGEATWYCSVLASLELAERHLDDGDLAAATRQHEAARSVVLGERLGVDAGDRLLRTAVLLALARDDAGAARAAAAAIVDGFWGRSARARVELHGGTRRGAVRP